MLLKTARVWKPRIHGKIKGKNENFSGENGFPIPISCKFSKGIQKNESRNLRIPEIAVQNRESLIGDENLEREREPEKKGFLSRDEKQKEEETEGKGRESFIGFVESLRRYFYVAVTSETEKEKRD
jgi:hypothetical protein